MKWVEPSVKESQLFHKEQDGHRSPLDSEKKTFLEGKPMWESCLKAVNLPNVRARVETR